MPILNQALQARAPVRHLLFKLKARQQFLLLPDQVSVLHHALHLCFQLLRMQEQHQPRVIVLHHVNIVLVDCGVLVFLTLIKDHRGHNIRGDHVVSNFGETVEESF